MAFYKNVASQKIAVYAYDTANDTPKTGDAANITAQISLDGGATAGTNDTNPTELDATDAPGVYIFDMTQAETNADLVILFAKSSSTDIVLEPVFIYTTPGDNAALTANVTEIGGDTQSATDLKDFADTGYDPTAHKVAGVVLVDTTTTNTDMRGTDSAFLASSAPTNFADLAITASTGKVTVGTNDDKTGYSLTATTGLGNQTANITGNLTGNIIGSVSGSVASVTGAINTAAGTITTLDGLDAAQDTRHDETQAKTDNLPASPAAVGSQMTLADGAITAAKIADDAITAAKLAADSIGNSQLATSAVSEIQAGLATAAKLVAYVQLLARSDAGLATDLSTELGEINADTGSGAGDYDNTRESQEATRDRGDSAWVTATGFSTLDAAGIRTAVGLASANLDTQLGDLATAAALTTAQNDLDIITGTDGVTLATTQGNYAPSTFDPGTAEIESGVTYLQGLRAACAALAGILSGANGSTITIKAIGAGSGGTTRITATVDADGNRSAVTLNL